MLDLGIQFLFTGAWLVVGAAVVLVAAFFIYMAIDYICDRVWGKPFLTEENRRKWWV